ncbi:MAG: TPM domain-containing protein [Leadbetterella sp.]|nr:TPM domain-containing protein [Leadbetterella sp.]
MFILSEIQQKNIVHAIHEAEELTSGEIKVHVEEHCPTPNPMERAAEVFRYLSLDKTALRNGVLLYLAYEDHKFAIIGDTGINEKAGQDFWNSTQEILQENFRIGDFENGFVKAIEEAGKKLQEHFPIVGPNENELPNDISFG